MHNQQHPIQQRRLPRFVLFMLIAVVIVSLDLWTKHLASTHLSYAVPHTVLPVFNITLHHNTGAAFSFLSDAGGWQRYFFTVLSTVVSLILIVWIYKICCKQLFLSVALTLILAGAIGNLWDRVTLGYVVDFLSFHYKDSYFPAFNLADSAITLGAIMMIMDSLFNNHSEPH